MGTMKLPPQFVRPFISLILVVALGLTSCTFVGAGGGAVIGSIRQPDPQLAHIIRTSRGADGQQVVRPNKPMSVAKHAAIGGALGFVVDAAVVVFAVFVLSTVCIGPDCHEDP